MTQEQTATPYLKEYLQYIDGNSDTKVKKEIVCDAFRGDNFGLMGFGAIKPAGRFLIYPEFCAFLTTMRAEQDSLKLFGTRFFDEMGPELRLMGLASSPEMIVLYIAKSMGRDKDEEEKKYLRAALTSPNSFFIPMNRIESVSTGRKAGLNSITINTPSESYTLVDNMMTTCPDPITYAMKKLSGGRPLNKPKMTNIPKFYGRYFTGKWEEDAVKILREAAQANRSRAVLQGPR